MKKLIASLVALLALAVTVPAQAAGGGIPWDKFPTEKMQDTAALQRGAKLFVNYCLNCHAAGPDKNAPAEAAAADLDRSVLADQARALAAAVHAVMGDEGEAVAAECAGRTVAAAKRAQLRLLYDAYTRVLPSSATSSTSYGSCLPL